MEKWWRAVFTAQFIDAVMYSLFSKILLFLYVR